MGGKHNEMPQYKLTYFNLRGRGELIRLVFAYAGQEYEDFRFEIAQWPEFKPKMPFKQAPILEVDGTVLTQSHSIARYLARTFKIAGKNDLEQAQTDEYVDLVYDLIGGMVVGFLEQDPEKKKQFFQSFFTEKLAPHLLLVMKALVVKVGNNENIKKYVDSRPVTPF